MTRTELLKERRELLKEKREKTRALEEGRVYYDYVQDWRNRVEEIEKLLKTKEYSLKQ